jgi:hypothetical protein
MLSRPRLAAFGMLMAALGCGPRESGGAPAPVESTEPSESPTQPAEPPTSSMPPIPGRYATKVELSGWFFIHTELRIDHAVSGSMVLQLDDDGRASACAGARETGGSSSRDENGNVESRDSDHAWIRGLAGTWSPTDSGLQVRFDRIDDERCEVAPDRSPLPTPLELDCTRLAANAVIAANAAVPDAALLCEVPKPDRLAKLALLLGDPPRAWVLAEQSPPGAAPIPEHINPFLLLGQHPGFELRLVDGGYQAGEPLRITAMKVPDPSPPTRQ